MGITAHLLYTVTSLLVLGALWAFIAANGKLYGRAHRWFIGEASPSRRSSDT